MGFLGDASNFFQAYNLPIIGSFFPNPHEQEKQRTFAKAANYFQEQRPAMIRAQQNMLNNRTAAYQGAADVMASMGIPTRGVGGASVNPWFQSPQQTMAAGAGAPAVNALSSVRSPHFSIAPGAAYMAPQMGRSGKPPIQTPAYMAPQQGQSLQLPAQRFMGGLPMARFMGAAMR